MICPIKKMKNKNHKKLREIINQFCNVAEHKIDTQKSGVLLHTNPKLSEKEIKETIPFKTCIKNNKIPRDQLTKDVQELYN